MLPAGGDVEGSECGGIRSLFFTMMSFGGKERKRDLGTYLSFLAEYKTRHSFHPYILQMPDTFGTSLLTALPQLWRKAVQKITSYF